MTNRFLLQTIILFLFAFLAKTTLAQTLTPANNATDVCVDMQFKITFSSNPVFQSSGTVKLYESNGALISTIDLSKMPIGTPMSATWPWTETLNSNTIRVMRATIDGKTAIFTFPINSLVYGKNYYVTVDKAVFSNASSLGFNGISANQWAFKVKTIPASDLNYTVAADGSGDFATLQGAFDFIPNGNTNAAKIYIKNGVYVGLAFTKGRNNVTLQGESLNGVIVKGFNNNNLNASTHWRSVVNIQGNDWFISNITFINTTPNGGTQAEVLKLQGDRDIIVKCEFYSYQDTVLIEGKVYFKDCLLEGDVDFIWGVGTVYFQNCEIRANDNGGYNVMARNDNTKHGYCFADCKITRKTSVTTSQTLGRDANTSYPYAEIVYLNCSLDKHITAEGWNIRNEMDASKIFFAEYKSVDMSGNLINTSSRHAKSRQLAANQAAQYRDLNWFFNGWTPVVPVQQSSPTIAITSPSNNTTKDAPATLSLTATATDSDGTIAKVEFFDGTSSIGIAIGSGSIFSYTWNSIPAGTYIITAVATDNNGNKTTSAAIHVIVKGSDCAGVAGGTAYTDNCSSCVGGTTGKIACSQVKVQAEDVSCDFPGIIESKNLGFEGVGYVNVDNAANTSVSFNIIANSATAIKLGIRYANGGTTDRPARILVNGIEAIASFSMPITTLWTDYQNIETNLNVKAGANKITLIALSNDGFANLDYFYLYGDAQFAGCETTQTISLSQGWNLISINVIPQSATIINILTDWMLKK
ncbi:MAG: Ig-like domain-containing protein [Bacteroidales bacterium]|nr:Ig-like domain-containing protein [Bacteroidales bacterium]